MTEIKIKSIVVKNYRIVLLVKVIGNKYSNEKIKDNLLLKFPSLRLHKCKNSNGDNFIDVADKTSMPHILEHLIIDFQIKLANTYGISSQTLFGTTEWLDKNFGTAKIEFSYFDDLVALKAIKSSVDAIGQIA